MKHSPKIDREKQVIKEILCKFSNTCGIDIHSGAQKIVMKRILIISK